MAAITVDGLVKRYGDLVAVGGVGFEVADGEIFGIIGPNGSGKTTTVECVQGLRRPDAGTIRVCGLDPGREPAALRRVVGSQLQESALPDRIRVAEALRLFAAPGPAAGRWVEHLERWGLAPKRNATFGSLSGGQRQRLLVALALVHDPRVVFLDEMTTGLDPAARRVAWQLVREVRSAGTTVVLVTHFMDEAERLADRIAVLAGGRVAALDTPARLVAAHGGGTTVLLRLPPATALPDLGRLPGFVALVGDGERVELRGDDRFVVHLGHALVSAGIEPVEMQIRQPTLEDALLALVGDAAEELA